ncbi:protein ADM2a [Clarias gariepinus]
MRSLFLPLTLYCISLLCLQIYTLPVANRLDFKTILRQLKEGSVAFPDSDPSPDDVTNAPAERLDRTALWRALLFKNPPSSSQKPASVIDPTVDSVVQEAELNLRSIRVRRNIRSRHHPRGQMMRVECVLGTCQVQKLSHRLYQLVGQNGREESAPISPHSPHSYG